MKKYIFSSVLILIVLSVLYNNAAYSVDKGAVETSGAGYIKWVDFNVTAEALNDTMKLDIETHGTDKHYSWIELLACLAVGNGGDFKNYNKKQLADLCAKLGSGKSFSESKLYTYYIEAYTAVLGGMVGEFMCDNERRYGLKAFSPIACGYHYEHYDDFGAARSYGYKRPHLGHDLVGSVGTPIIAVESGYVEAAGWNQYGGWRIGIRSFDSKRYYYYAHLRKNHPYNDIYEGKIVNAGDVIGYLGMTGYSAEENVNNIETPHLHYGLQLIFDKSQKDGYNQIWIDMYELTKFLSQNRASVFRDDAANEYNSVNNITDIAAPD